MINWTQVNELQTQKLQLELKLNEILHTPNHSIDEVNELKSEIIYLDKKIGKQLGAKELERQKELSKKKSGIEQINIKGYYALKDKYKKISKMKLATERMLKIIGLYQQNLYLEDEQRVKVK